MMTLKMSTEVINQVTSRIISHRLLYIIILLLYYITIGLLFATSGVAPFWPLEQMQVLGTSALASFFMPGGYVHVYGLTSK